MIKSLIWLKFVSERNLFFEQRHALFKKFPFLVSNTRFKNSWYLVFFSIRPHVTLLFYPLLIAIMAGEKLFVALGGGLYVLGCFFSKASSLEWRLFERYDIIFAIPQTATRLLTIFFRNLLLTLVIYNSPIIIFVTVCVLLSLPILPTLSLTISIILLFTAREMHSFVLRYSTFKHKKMISWSYYFFLALLETAGYILLIQTIINAITRTINSIKNGADLLEYVEHTLAMSVTASDFLAQHAVSILLGSLIVFLLLLAISYSLHALSRNNRTLFDSNPTIENFAALRQLKNILCKHQNTLKRSLFHKEYQLFASLYHYNFKDYPRVFLPDSATYSAVITLSYFLFHYPNQWRDTIFCIAVFTAMITELYQRTNNYLAAHMSFVADYNTIRVFNAGNHNLELLLKTKLTFFYSISISFTLVFFTIFNALGMALHLNTAALIFLNFLCVTALAILPTTMLISNIIHTRLDYRDVKTFLTDTSLKIGKIRVFLPIRILININFYLFLGVLGIVSFAPFLPFPNEILIGFLITQLTLLPALALITNRIKTNILSSISQGNYTAELTRVFSRKNPIRRFLS